MEEHTLSQRALAETLGTALLVLVGPGSVVATLVLAGDKVPAIDGSDLLGISFAFGLVITALVYAIGKVSGCHINPAVTFALASTKRFPWKEVPTYMGAQLVGGTLGALGIWALFTKTGVDMGLGQASFNEDSYTWGSAIFAEFIGTAILMFAILGIVDARSPGDFAGLVIGGVVVAIIMVLGPITAASLNPARAIGPAIAATKRFSWSEVPGYWGAQLVGGTLGALGIWALFTQTGVDMGLGQASFNEETYTWGSAIFAEFIGTGILMFAILGIVDARSPGDFAGIVIGGVVVAIIMVLGPITAASLNPARAIGPALAATFAGGDTHWNQIIPVYVLPGLAGAAVAAFAYDFLATPRTVKQPIESAVTHPDPVEALAAK